MGNVHTKKHVQNEKNSDTSFHSAAALPIQRVHLAHGDGKQAASAEAVRKEVENIIRLCTTENKKMIKWKKVYEKNDSVMLKSDAALRSALRQDRFRRQLSTLAQKRLNEDTKRLTWYCDVVMAEKWVRQNNRLKVAYNRLLQIYEMDAVADLLQSSKNCIEQLKGWIDLFEKTFKNHTLCIHQNEVCNAYWKVENLYYPDVQSSVRAIVKKLPERVQFCKTKRGICKCSNEKVLEAARIYSRSVSTMS